MKKTLKVIAATVALISQCAVLNAQIDTLFFGDREPSFYYWGDYWVDYITAHDKTGDNIIDGEGSGIENGAPEEGRPCSTNTPLRAVGVAVAATINGYFAGCMPVAEGATMLPEYARVRRNGDYEILAEARFDTATPRYVNYIGGSRYMNVYEAYFDSAIYVSDTFYVTSTHNNNYNIAVDSDWFDGYGIILWNYEIRSAHPRTSVGFSYHRLTEENYINHSPFGRHIIRMYTISDKFNSHAYLTNKWYRIATPRDYMHVFLIFDTTTFYDSTAAELCMPPTHVRTGRIAADSTMVMWNANGGERSEVSVCDAGCSVPDSGVVMQTTASFAFLTQLEHGGKYTVWVRNICENGDTSQWSDGLLFEVPADSGSIEAVMDVDNEFFHISPNPASDVVNVFSSFKIHDLSIYATDGRLMKRERVDGLSKNVDISMLPKGMYIVRATTVHGMAYGRLVVQ